MIAAIQDEHATFTRLFEDLKHEITSETLVETGDGDKPGIEVTIGWRYNPRTNEFDWDYQTGDNSYHGAAYSYQFWVTTTILRMSNSADLAQDVIDEIQETIACNAACNERLKAHSVR